MSLSFFLWVEDCEIVQHVCGFCHSDWLACFNSLRTASGSCRTLCANHALFPTHPQPKSIPLLLCQCSVLLRYVSWVPKVPGCAPPPKWLCSFFWGGGLGKVSVTGFSEKSGVYFWGFATQDYLSNPNRCNNISRCWSIVSFSWVILCSFDQCSLPIFLRGTELSLQRFFTTPTLRLMQCLPSM